VVVVVEEDEKVLVVVEEDEKVLVVAVAVAVAEVGTNDQ
jgi:hypothetical protein